MRRLPIPSVLSLAALAAALLAFALPAGAQVLYGTLVGNVTDSSGAAVPGAAVTLINTEHEPRARGHHQRRGRLPLRQRAARHLQGPRVLTGFKEYVKDGVPDLVDAPSPASTSRSRSARSREAVTVQSETTRCCRPTPATSIASSRPRRSRACRSGTTATTRASSTSCRARRPRGSRTAITDTPERALSTNVNGTARNSNNTRLDGATNIFVWLPHHAVYVAPAETVDTRERDDQQASTPSRAWPAAPPSPCSPSPAPTSSTASGFWLSSRTRACGPGTGPTLGRQARQQAEHRRRHPRRSHPEGQAVLLRVLGRALHDVAEHAHGRPLPTDGDARRRLQRLRHHDLRPGHRQRRTARGRTPFPNNVIPANRISSIAQQLQSRLPVPERSGHVQQLHQHGAGGLQPQQLRRSSSTTTSAPRHRSSRSTAR